MYHAGVKANTLERATLRDHARVAIRTGVVTGDLEPAALYTIGALAVQLGVSATPVRDALSDLASDGLIRVIPSRGFIVPPVSARDLDEIFELRLVLEVPAVGLAAGRLDEVGHGACRDYVEQGRAAAVAGDLALFLEFDVEFHRQLLLPLGNQRLIEIIEKLRVQTRLYGLPRLAAENLLTTAANEHKMLLEAVAAGDAKSAREQMSLHLRHTRGSWAGEPEPAR